MINKVIEDTKELMVIFMKHMNKFDMSSPDYLKTMALSGRLKSASLAYQKSLEINGEKSPKNEESRINYEKLLKESEEYIHINIDNSRRARKKKKLEEEKRRALELKRMREESLKNKSNGSNISSINKITNNDGNFVPKGTIGKYTIVYGEIYGAEYIGANEEINEVKKTLQKYRNFVDILFKNYNYQRILWNENSFVIFFNDSVIAINSVVEFKLKMTLFNINSNSLRKTIRVRIALDSGEDFQKHTEDLSRKCEESVDKCKALVSSLKFMDDKNFFVKMMLSQECFMSKKIPDSIIKNIEIKKCKVNTTVNDETKTFVAYHLM